MGALFNSRFDQWVWQRRALRVLGQVLDRARPDRDGDGGLPRIAWTIGDAGASLTGRVTSTRTDGITPLEAFTAWRTALGLREIRDHHDRYLGQRRLTAWTRHYDGLVDVAVIAEIWDEDSEADR